MRRCVSDNILFGTLEICWTAAVSVTDRKVSRRSLGSSLPPPATNRAIYLSPSLSVYQQYSTTLPYSCSFPSHATIFLGSDVLSRSISKICDMLVRILTARIWRTRLGRPRTPSRSPPWPACWTPPRNTWYQSSWWLVPVITHNNATSPNAGKCKNKCVS